MNRNVFSLCKANIVNLLQLLEIDISCKLHDAFQSVGYFTLDPNYPIAMVNFLFSFIISVR